MKGDPAGAGTPLGKLGKPPHVGLQTENKVFVLIFRLCRCRYFRGAAKEAIEDAQILDKMAAVRTDVLEAISTSRYKLKEKTPRNERRSSGGNRKTP